MTEDQKPIQELREQILVLQQQLDWFKRQLFGKKGEQFQHPDFFGDPEVGKPETSTKEEPPEEADDANAKKTKSMASGVRDFSVKSSATASSTTCHMIGSRSSMPIASGFTSPSKQ